MKKFVEAVLLLAGVAALVACVWLPHDWWRWLLSAFILLVAATAVRDDRLLEKAVDR